IGTANTVPSKNACQTFWREIAVIAVSTQLQGAHQRAASGTPVTGGTLPTTPTESFDSVAKNDSGDSRRPSHVRPLLGYSKSIAAIVTSRVPAPPTCAIASAITAGIAVIISSIRPPRVRIPPSTVVIVEAPVTVVVSRIVHAQTSHNTWTRSKSRHSMHPAERSMAIGTEDARSDTPGPVWN